MITAAGLYAIPALLFLLAFGAFDFTLRHRWVMFDFMGGLAAISNNYFHAISSRASWPRDFGFDMGGLSL